MTTATITLTYKDSQNLIEVLLNAIELIKRGEQKGIIERGGVVARYEQEILVDYEKLDIRHENGNMIIKSKI
jgi:hypothetical protein